MLKSRGFWIGIVVSLVFIGLFVRSTDFGEVRRAFRDANYWWVAASLPVYFAGLWIRTIRWQYLLKPIRRVSTPRLYPVVIIGLMANNLIPARAGELARAYVLGVRERVSKTTTLGTIAVDRIFDGVTLVPMMLIVAALAGDEAHFKVGFGSWQATLNFAGLGAVMSVLFGVAIVILGFLAFSQRGRDTLHRVVHAAAPGRLKPKVEYLVHSFFDGLSALRSPVDLAIALVMSTVSWMLEATMYYMIARGFGIGEPFYVFLLLTAAANLAIAVVASQGGVGPFELVVKETLVSFGVAPELGAAYAIGLHAVLLFPIIALGLYLMWSMKLTFGDMLKSSQEASSGEDVTTGDGESAATDAAGGSRTMRSVSSAVEAEPS